MRTIKGSALFLAWSAGDAAPFDSWDGITKPASDRGDDGVQVATGNARFADLDTLATSQSLRRLGGAGARERGRSDRASTPSNAPDRLDGRSRCNMLYGPSHYVLQCLDYIDIHADRIRMFHVKEALMM